MIKKGVVVKFTGCSKDQHAWGNHTGDFTKLTVGERYTVERVEVHSFHTKVFLEGIDGSFNSVCFKAVIA